MLSYSAQAFSDYRWRSPPLQANPLEESELTTKSMLDNLRLSFGFLSLLIGVLLLREGVSNADASQTARVVGGAVLVSLGLISIWFVLKNWLELRKYFKNNG